MECIAQGSLESMRVAASGCVPSWDGVIPTLPHQASWTPSVVAQSPRLLLRRSWQVSLVRMLKIDAQSSSVGRRRKAGAVSSPSRDFSGLSRLSPHTPDSPVSKPPQDVLVTVIHSPIHMGSLLQAPAPRDRNARVTTTGSPSAEHRGRCSAFALSSPACARVFPLRRCDLKGGGGEGAGAPLLAAAAGADGAGTQGRDGLVTAEDVPREERLRFRLVRWRYYSRVPRGGMMAGRTGAGVGRLVLYIPLDCWRGRPASYCPVPLTVRDPALRATGFLPTCWQKFSGSSSSWTWAEPEECSRSVPLHA